MTYTQAIEAVSALSESVGKAKDAGFKSRDKVDAVARLDAAILKSMQDMDDTDAAGWPTIFAGPLALARDCETLGLARATPWVRTLARLASAEVSGPARPPESRAGQTTGARTPRPADPDETTTDAGRVWIPVSGIQPGQIPALQAWILDNGAADKAGARLAKSWREGIEQEQARRALADKRRAAAESVQPVQPDPETDHTAAYLAQVEERTARLESMMGDLVALVRDSRTTQPTRKPRAKVSDPDQVATS